MDEKTKNKGFVLISDCDLPEEIKFVTKSFIDIAYQLTRIATALGDKYKKDANYINTELEEILNRASKLSDSYMNRKEDNDIDFDIQFEQLGIDARDYLERSR